MDKKFSFITFAALALCFLTASCVKESEFDDRVSDIVKVQLDTLNRKVALLEEVQKWLAADVESISDDVDSLYGECLSLTISIGEVKDTLQQEHDWTQKELYALGVRIDALAKAQETFKIRVDIRLGRLENRIQDIDVIPDYIDGSVKFYNYTSSVVSFAVRPDSIARRLAENHPDGDTTFRILVKQVLTKSSDIFDTLDVESVSYEEGIVFVKVNGAGLAGGNSYIACLVIKDGNSEVASEFFPVTIESAPGTLYLIGTTNDWDLSSEKQKLVGFLKEDSTFVYSGFVYMRPDSMTTDCICRFLVNNGSFDGSVDYSSFTSVSENLERGDELNNIKFKEGEGVYYVELTLGSESRVAATKINNMNLVGDFNGWSVTDTTQVMSWNPDSFCWEKTGTGVTSAGWKFIANNGWDINFGGTVDNLYQNGANLLVAGNKVVLYPTRIENDNIHCTVTTE